MTFICEGTEPEDGFTEGEVNHTPCEKVLFVSLNLRPPLVSENSHTQHTKQVKAVTVFPQRPSKPTPPGPFVGHENQ